MTNSGLIRKSVGSGTSSVVTGGGTFVDPQNRAVINRDGVSIWLDVPLEGLIARVPADGRRPLAADRADFERLYAARQTAYQLAHHRIEVGRAGVEMGDVFSCAGRLVVGLLR